MEEVAELALLALALLASSPDLSWSDELELVFGPSPESESESLSKKPQSSAPAAGLSWAAKAMAPAERAVDGRRLHQSTLVFCYARSFEWKQLQHRTAVRSATFLPR